MTGRAKREPRYIAFCMRCYSCYLERTDSKKVAWRAAASHASAYPGHQTDVLDGVEEAARKAALAASA